MVKTAILLKLTGELFVPGNAGKKSPIVALIPELTALATTHTLGIVVGGGNFFRGDVQGKTLGLSAATGHEVGMLATILNGRILQELLEGAGARTSLMSAISCPKVAHELSQHRIDCAKRDGNIMIFAGGTGNPFCSTDTNAVIRALQIGASIVWKGTKVDGVYEQDPAKHPQAKRFEALTYTEALEKGVGVMDHTALTLAQENDLTTYVFDIFAPDALSTMQSDQRIATKVTT